MEETKMTENEVTQKSNSNNGFLVLIVIIGFVANMGFSYWLTTQNSGGNLQDISQKVDKLSKSDVLRSGGDDNYKLLEKIYSSPAYQQQQAQSLKAALAQFGITDNGTGGTTGANEQQPSQKPSDNAQTEKSGKLTQDEIKAILKDAYIKGDKAAKITIVEFADLECPFCKKFEAAGTIDSVIAKYQGKVNSTFKHFPLSFHQNAMTGGLMLECVGQISKGDKYFEFLKKSGEADQANQSTWTSIAKDLGITDKKLNACLADNSFKDKISADQKLGQEKFGISGTPASVIINTETGDWALVSGAVPQTNIDAVVDSYLK